MQRPLSPHLQVYTLPLTAVLSVMHRMAGAFLSLGAIAFTIWLVLASGDKETYDAFAFAWYSWYAKILLYGWIAALYFHLANGVRHLFWDVGYGFELKTVDRSAIFVILFTIFMTMISWVLIAIMQDKI